MCVCWYGGLCHVVGMCVLRWRTLSCSSCMLIPRYASIKLPITTLVPFPHYSKFTHWNNYHYSYHQRKICESPIQSHLSVPGVPQYCGWWPWPFQAYISSLQWPLKVYTNFLKCISLRVWGAMNCKAQKCQSFCWVLKVMNEDTSAFLWFETLNKPPNIRLESLIKR